MLLSLVVALCLHLHASAQTQPSSKPTAAQDTVKLVTVILERADEVSGGEFLDSTFSPPLREEFRSAIGNVLFRESTTTVECDTALQYLTTRKIRVVSNVKIVRDTVTITGYEGFYFPDERRSELKKDVTLSDTKVLLKSDSGIYFSNERRASSVAMSRSKIVCKWSSAIVWSIFAMMLAHRLFAMCVL